MKLSDNSEQLIAAAAFICIGIIAAIIQHDKTASMQRQIDSLTAINSQALALNEKLRYCYPRNPGKAIITRTESSVFCEIHYNRR